MKYCVDCAHFRGDWGSPLSGEFAKCAMVADDHWRGNAMVSPFDSLAYRYCSHVRDRGPCGPDAKLFEPRRRWWKQLFGRAP